jgi:hypothetical protein
MALAGRVTDFHTAFPTVLAAAGIPLMVSLTISLAVIGPLLEIYPVLDDLFAILSVLFNYS